MRGPASGGLVRRASLPLVVIAAITLLPAPHAGSSIAPTGTELPFHGFFDMAVDMTHQHVFVTGGQSTSEIAVLDFDGHLVRTIGGVSDPAGMILDGNILYVGRAMGYWMEPPASIYKIDAATLSVTGAISVPTRTSGDLGFEGGYLWYSTDACSAWGALAALDPITGNVVWTGSGNDRALYCPTFSSSPSRPSQLVIGDARSFRYDVSMVPPTLEASGSGPHENYVLSPDGATALGYGITEIRTSDFQLTGRTYGTATQPAAATEAEGGLIAGSTNRQNYYFFDLYRSTDSSLLASFNMGQPPALPRGGAFDGSGSSLFVVSDDENGQTSFFVLDPSRRNTELSLTVSAKIVPYGTTTTVTAHLQVQPEW
jgi:hypothetical protein